MSGFFDLTTTTVLIACLVRNELGGGFNTRKV